MYSVFDIANYYLQITPMSPKKMQKIVYYAYAWFLTLMNEDRNHLDNRLFDERPEAWVHGPVFPELYKKYKSFGYDEIKESEEPPLLSNDVKDILDDVWGVYGSFSANELESISHQEKPWINARENYSRFEPCTCVLSDKDIFDCYSSRIDV